MATPCFISSRPFLANFMALAMALAILILAPLRAAASSALNLSSDPPSRSTHKQGDEDPEARNLQQI